MGPIGSRGGDRSLAGVSAAAAPAGIRDPRAVRVALAPAADDPTVEPIVVEPPAGDGLVLIDGQPLQFRLERFDAIRRVLVEGSGESAVRSAIILMPIDGPTGGAASGVVRLEVIVDGWRIEVQLESERRAELRQWASRGRAESASGGATEVRAVLPGRVLAVSIAPGDTVVAGQQILVVEAMKMQNELRAPRDGVVARLAVGAGQTIEVGDLLLVLA